MSISTQSKQIGNHTYNVTTFGAVKGQEVLVKLINFAAPFANAFRGIAAAASGELGDERIEQLAGEALVDGVSKFAQAVTPEVFSWLCLQFANATQIEYEDGKAQPLSKVYEAHFSGEYLELLTWFAFVVQVNYASFFTGQGKENLLGRWIQKLAKNSTASSSQATSIGGSGASSPTKEST